jgi:hypothetical protein
MKGFFLYGVPENYSEGSQARPLVLIINVLKRRDYFMYVQPLLHGVDTAFEGLARIP